MASNVYVAPQADLNQNSFMEFSLKSCLSGKIPNRFGLAVISYFLHFCVFVICSTSVVFSRLAFASSD